MARCNFVCLALFAVAALATATPALAADPAWKVEPPNNGAASMTRTIENVTLVYARVPDDYDSLTITVADCGDQQWSQKDSLDQVSADELKEAVSEAFDNARGNCTVSDGIEARFMDGFEAAFAAVKPVLPPHVAQVGGWTIEDKDSQPGDDSDRSLSMKKELASVSMTYSPSASGEGASFTLQFLPCNRHSYSTGFDFGDPPEDHVKAVNEEVADSYADFAKECKTRPDPQSALMGDFPQALATIEQWLKDKPFVYPDSASSADSGDEDDDSDSAGETEGGDTD